VAPRPGEDDRLGAERTVLANADRLSRLSSEAYQALYEREGADLPGGPWAFRNESGATGPVRGGEEAERLMEMERGVLRSMTSCGWFFDDIAGIEARQVLRYAAHAISLAGPEAPRLEAGFIEKLGNARSNDPKAGSAADVFRQTAQPTHS